MQQNLRHLQNRKGANMAWWKLKPQPDPQADEGYVKHTFHVDSPAMPVIMVVLILMLLGLAIYRGCAADTQCEASCSPARVDRCGNTYAVCMDGTVKTW